MEFKTPMSNSINNNPLSSHFRQPAIYLKLPSGGKFYPRDTLDMSLTGEIPIFPMTIKDEILLKTPDALMNGEGMRDMIASCCPNIKDPWSIPLIDLDTILIAIRLASYGSGMDMTSDCPHCKSGNEHTVDLRVVLDNLSPIKKYNETSHVNGLLFKLKPQTYRDLNKVGLISFEQEKLISVISNSELSEEDKKEKFNEAFTNLTNLNISTLVSCIESITTEDGIVVSEAVLIQDFLVNTDRKTYESVKTLIQDTVGANTLDPVDLVCNECAQPYKVKMEFNQTRFFA
jgi:hypothetical protein